MVQKKIQVAREKGLNARPAAVLVQKASQFKSNIFVEYQNKKVNAKSIMGMMSLSLAQGESVVVSADGPDEENAVSGIEEYLGTNK